MMATFMAMMIPRAAVCAERIGEVLDTESSVRAAGDAGHASSPRTGELELRDVGSRYPGAEQPVLQRHLASPPSPGQTTAIIGSTGAGKTTLLSPDPAAVRRHRRAACWSTASTSATSTPRLLWRRIGLVPQKPYLFSGTVASNLRYGNPDATDERAVGGAARSPRPRDFVEAMPDGLDAPIAQGGTNVSGGQRQRLAIARALVAQAGDLPVRRLVLGARPGDRRPAAGGAARRSPRDAAVVDRRPAGLHHRRRRPDPRARGRRDRRPRHATTSCSTTCPTYAEIVDVAARPRRRRHERRREPTERAPAGRRRRAPGAARPAARSAWMRHAGREVDELRPVGAAAARPAAPGAAAVVLLVIAARPSSSVGARACSARRSSATPPTSSSPASSASSCPLGITKEQVVAALRAHGQRQLRRHARAA